MDKDDEQLALLVTAHKVVAGVTALFGCFPVIHLAVGIAMLTGVIPDTARGGPPLALIGLIFTVIPALLIAAMWSLAVATFVAARRLAARTHRTYCMVVAVLQCFMPPFGTALGVLSLVVLLRESVKARFGEGTPAGVGARPRAGLTRCPFCRDEVSDEAVACTACLSRHHARCWDEHGRCASCAGLARFAGVERAAPEVERDLRPRSRGLEKTA